MYLCSAASFELADYSQVDVQDVRHTLVNFGAGKSPGSPSWCARIDEDIARSVGGPIRCRADMAHMELPRPDSGLGLQVQVRKTMQAVSSWLGSGPEAIAPRVV